MSDVRITCIRLSQPNGNHEHITHVGGQGWTRTREEAVQLIESRANSFHVIGSTGKRAEVEVITPTYGAKYLRTRADGVLNDNLLSLPRCQ